MKDPSLAVDPTLTIEYQKLFTAASRYREVCLPLLLIVLALLPCSCALPACFPTITYLALNQESEPFPTLHTSASPQTLYCTTLASCSDVRQVCPHSSSSQKGEHAV